MPAVSGRIQRHSPPHDDRTTAAPACWLDAGGTAGIWVIGVVTRIVAVCVAVVVVGTLSE